VYPLDRGTKRSRELSRAKFRWTGKERSAGGKEGKREDEEERRRGGGPCPLHEVSSSTVDTLERILYV